MLPDSQETYDHVGERRHETINNRTTCKVKFYALPSVQSGGVRGHNSRVRLHRPGDLGAGLEDEVKTGVGRPERQ